MEIISYNDNFKEQVIALVLHIQNIETRLDLSLEEQPDLSDIESYFLAGQGAFWLAVENGRVIGTIALKRVTETGGVLKKFFVDKEFRGKKIGLQLFKTLIEFCQDNHISQIVLDTPSAATRSHDFYEKAGFRKIQEKELPFSYEYPNRNSLLFLKELSREKEKKQLLGIT